VAHPYSRHSSPKPPKTSPTVTKTAMDGLILRKRRRDLDRHMHQTARWVAPRNNNTVRSAGCVGPAGVLRSRRNTSCHARTTPCDYCRAQHRGVAECDGTGHAVLSVDEHKPNQLPCPMATGTGSQGMDLDWTRYPIEWEEDYMSGRLRATGGWDPSVARLARTGKDVCSPFA